MLDALLRGMMKIAIYCHIILGPHAKNQDQISKIDWFMDNFRFFKHQVEKNVFGQKWPPFGQMSIFWALVFCKHPHFYKGWAKKNLTKLFQKKSLLKSTDSKLKMGPSRQNSKSDNFYFMVRIPKTKGKYRKRPFLKKVHF